MTEASKRQQGWSLSIQDSAFRAGCPVTCILFLPVCRCRLEKSARKRGKAKASNLNANRWPNSTKSQLPRTGVTRRNEDPHTGSERANPHAYSHMPEGGATCDWSRSHGLPPWKTATQPLLQLVSHTAPRLAQHSASCPVAHGGATAAKSARFETKKANGETGGGLISSTFGPACVHVRDGRLGLILKGCTRFGAASPKPLCMQQQTAAQFEEP